MNKDGRHRSFSLVCLFLSILCFFNFCFIIFVCKCMCMFVSDCVKLVFGHVRLESNVGILIIYSNGFSVCEVIVSNCK